jgi:hypothetical protein
MKKQNRTKKIVSFLILRRWFVQIESVKELRQKCGNQRDFQCGEHKLSAGPFYFHSGQSRKLLFESSKQVYGGSSGGAAAIRLDAAAAHTTQRRTPGPLANVRSKYICATLKRQ